MAAVMRARRRARRRWERKSPEKLAIIATEEVYKDPATGRMMRVWIDPNDGTRYNASTSNDPKPSEEV
jgi:hypothetical protein